MPGTNGGDGRHPIDPPRGVLGVAGRLPFRLRRWAPPADLTWCVSNFWVTVWELPEGRAVTARVLPHAAVNLTLESGDRVVTGVPSGVFSRTLRGSDRAFGVKFAPGAFRLLTAVPIGSLSGAGQPAAGVLDGADGLRATLVQAVDDDERMAATVQWLRASGARCDATLQLVQNAHTALVGDPTVRRVHQVADRLEVSPRTLQRMFADYLGVSPGWVLRRGRPPAVAERVLQLAAGRADLGYADVAAEFGYADQAHFTHEFRRVLGAAPGVWAAQLVEEHAG
ncbi:MAG: DUF6597 domain-containing transcriptional factor [Propionibacteriaceae bacterium]